MEVRPASGDDVPAIAALDRRWETVWFGAPEQDEDEVRERFDRAEDSVLVLDGDRPIAASWWAGVDASLVVDPAAAVEEVYPVVLAWLERQPGLELSALNRDAKLLAALDTRGWRHVNSSFELIRPVTDDWVLADPVWPDGIVVGALGPDDRPAVHHLIYVDAAWSEVPGHPDRTFDEWREIFVNDRVPADQQVLAWRGEQLVGAALGRIFADGTGWVAQLAVAKPERGRGLGQALLLAALHRRRAAGATSVGLGVQVENRTALGLYLGVGLTIDREWMEFRLG
jgi:mycothiol synthase